MLKTCRDMASSEYEPDNEGLLLHGVYATARGRAWMSLNLWGDFFLYGRSAPASEEGLDPVFITGERKE